MKSGTITCLSLLLALPAAAGFAQEPPTYDRIDLNASAQREVSNDLMIAVVFAEVEDNDQEQAANAVNNAISWAADRARTARGVTLQTQQYTTRAVYAPNSRRITGWIARQSLRLESDDAETLSELLGTLQERVAIQSMGSALSKAARDKAEEDLIAEAIAAFRRRAELIARELGRDDYRLVHLGVGTSGFNPIMMTGARVASDRMLEASAPEIEAGVQTVTVSVNGTIELKREL
jgi:predicted secreted protein